MSIFKIPTCPRCNQALAQFSFGKQCDWCDRLDKEMLAPPELEKEDKPLIYWDDDYISL